MARINTTLEAELLHGPFSKDGNGFRKGNGNEEMRITVARPA